MLGDAYEYLIYQFADDAGKKGGEFYTPREVVRLIVEMLEPQERMRICDPTAVSCGMLIYAAQYVQEQGGDIRNLVIHGQDATWAPWPLANSTCCSTACGRRGWSPATSSPSRGWWTRRDTCCPTTGSSPTRPSDLRTKPSPR